MLRPEKTQKLTTRFERSDRAEVRLLLLVVRHIWLKKTILHVLR